MGNDVQSHSRLRKWKLKQQRELFQPLKGQNLKNSNKLQSSMRPSADGHGEANILIHGGWD